MSEKRFYWLKLSENFFDENILLGLRRQEHGSDLVVIYQKMLLRSLRSGGKLPVLGMLPSAAEEIAMTINEDAQLVQSALDFLERFGQVEVQPDGVVMVNFSEMTGSESSVTTRVRQHRKRKKAAQENAEDTQESCNNEALQCNDSAFQRNTEKEKEEEIEIELDKDKEIESDEEKERAFGKHRLALLSGKEYRSLVSMSSSSVVEKYIAKYDKWLFSKKKQASNGFEPIKSWIEKDLPQKTDETSYDLSAWSKMAASFDPNSIPFLDE